MQRLDLINIIAGLIDARDYLEIGVAEGNTLAYVQAPNRTGVDPAPRYKDMSPERLDALRKLEIYEAGSDEFFARNARTFDLIFVDGLHLYEQAMKDILNGLNALNPGGFIVVHDLIPEKPEHAARERCSFMWNGDVWKVVFDLWRHHPSVSYFVVDSDQGLGVLWKNDPNSRYVPAWRELVRNLDFSVLQEAGCRFLNRVEPDEAAVRARLDAARAAMAPGVARAAERAPRRELHGEAEFKQALAGEFRRDCVWTLDTDKYERVDEARFFSNYPLELYRKKVLANTGGNLYRPELRAYVLNDALLCPCTPSQGRWPYLWNIWDRHGRSMADLLQRQDGPGPDQGAAANPERLEGLHLYLGWFAPYFGHFLSEVMPQLWFMRLVHETGAKVLFHVETGEPGRWESRTDDLKAFITDVLALHHIPLDRLVFVDRPVRVERMAALTPVNRYTFGARPEMFEVAGGVADALAAPGGERPKRLFFSRSRFPGRRLVNSAQIEALFARRGFSVLHPQDLSLPEQMALARNAEIIAGEEGSALCNAFFARDAAVIDIESGRYHPNLSKLSCAHARRYGYILPYTSTLLVPQAPQKCMLYAHPWVVEEALAGFFGDVPGGEAACGPRQAADLLEQAFSRSFSRNAAPCLESLLALVQSHPAQFCPDHVPHCLANLAAAGAPDAELALFSTMSLRILNLWKATLRRAATVPPAARCATAAGAAI